MTLDKAIQLIDEIASSYYPCDKKDALEMSILALEQQPCEDAISRQDALDALHMCLSTNSYDDDVTGDSYICYEEAEYEIEKLPSVQPKPIECEDAISRQAAIDEIKSHYRVDNDLLEVIAYKISKLPSVQPKPVECEDAISMMDLLNNLHKHFSKGFETDEWWNSTHVLQAVKDCRPELFDLNYVSSVQPKPKTGQWVLLDECSNSGYYCSECHKKVVKEGWSDTVKKIKFCPNCGSYLGGD